MPWLNLQYISVLAHDFVFLYLVGCVSFVGYMILTLNSSSYDNLGGYNKWWWKKKKTQFDIPTHLPFSSSIVSIIKTINTEPTWVQDQIYLIGWEEG